MNVFAGQKEFFIDSLNLSLVVPRSNVEATTKKSSSSHTLRKSTKLFNMLDKEISKSLELKSRGHHNNFTIGLMKLGTM